MRNDDVLVAVGALHFCRSALVFCSFHSVTSRTDNSLFVLHKGLDRISYVPVAAVFAPVLVTLVGAFIEAIKMVEAAPTGLALDHASRVSLRMALAFERVVDEVHRVVLAATQVAWIRFLIVRVVCGICGEDSRVCVHLFVRLHALVLFFFLGA